MAVAFVAKSANATYSTGSPGVVLPAGISAGNGIYILVGTKPDTAGPASATGYTNIGAFTGGTGTTGIDTGPMRIGVLFKEADGTESGATVTVTVPSNNVSWALGWVLSKSSSAWLNELVGGDDSTGGSSAYSATSTSNPGVTTGDYVIAACAIPTDACTVAVNGALTNNLTQTGTTFGTAQASGNLESASGQDIGGHVRGVPVSSGTGSANLVYTVTFTGSTNTYGPTAFVRVRESAVTLIANNRITLNEQSFESSVSGYTGDGNTTLSLSTAQANDGSRSMLLTSVASGDVEANLNSAFWPTVTVGEAVEGYLWARSPVSTTGQYFVDWHTSGGSYVSTSSGTSTSLPANTWTKIPFTGTVPATVGLAAVYVHIAATASSQAHHVDTVYFGPPLAIERTITDNLGLTDSPIAQGRTATGTEPVDLTDSVSAQLSTGAVRTVDDNLGLTDTAAVVEAHARTQTDNLGLTDTRVVEAAHARTQTDNLGLTDTRLVELGQVRSQTDNLGLTDTAAVSAGHSRAQSDTLGLADTPAVVEAHSRSQTDNLGLTDDVTPDLFSNDLTRTVNDNLGLTDARALALGLVITDPIGIGDSPITQGLGASGTDNLGLTDGVSVDLTSTDLTRTGNDTIGLSDEGVDQVFDVADTFTQNLGLTDSVSVQTSGGHSRTIDDTLDLSDTDTDQVLDVADTLTDALGLTDTRTVAVAHGRSQTDTLGLTDSVTVQTAGAGTRTADDTTGLTDTVTAVTTSIRTVTDPLGLTDVRTPEVGRAVTDSLGLTDTRAPQVGKEPTNTLGLTDSISVVMSWVRTVADLLALTDAAAQFTPAVRTSTDTAGLTDSVSVQSLSTTDQGVTDAIGLTSEHLVVLTTVRASTGTTTRPATGTTTRPNTGVTYRYPLIPD